MRMEEIHCAEETTDRRRNTRQTDRTAALASDSQWGKGKDNNKMHSKHRMSIYLDPSRQEASDPAAFGADTDWWT